jgi:hemerythrin-like metal-binding protein
MDKSIWTIEWSDAISMSNPVIDKEHQQFITLVNQLNMAILDRDNKETIVNIMQRIYTHSELHFASEERLFAENHYPLADEHTQIHTKLLETFKQYLEKMEKSLFSKEWIFLGLAIKDLLVEHVVEEDMKYKDYLRTD